MLKAIKVMFVSFCNFFAIYLVAIKGPDKIQGLVTLALAMILKYDI